MMKIFVLNSGSSSLKFQLIQMPDAQAVLRGVVDGIGLPQSFISIHKDGKETKRDALVKDHAEAVSAAIESINASGWEAREIGAVGHRVVHGGEKYKSAAIVNEEVIKDITDLSQIAPLHNPANLKGIEACRQFLPGIPNVAVFDTSFHQTLPPKAYLYGLPYELYQKHGIRKYGFHGISHRYVSREAMRLLKENIKDFKILSCHLGSGASICAISGGKSIEISMGFTPLEGLMMGTRAGSFDPEIILFLLKHGYTVDQVEEMIQKKGGLKGIAQNSDIRELREEELSGNKKSELAFDMFVYRVQRFIGSYTAVLGGLEVLIFTGGIGEKAYYIRRKICEQFGYMGLKLDTRKNRANETVISEADSDVTVMVVPTNEELEIARESYALLKSAKAGKAPT